MLRNQPGGQVRSERSSFDSTLRRIRSSRDGEFTHTITAGKSHVVLQKVRLMYRVHVREAAALLRIRTGRVSCLVRLGPSAVCHFPPD